jgi:hypothetical protein
MSRTGIRSNPKTDHGSVFGGSLYYLIVCDLHPPHLLVLSMPLIRTNRGLTEATYQCSFIRFNWNFMSMPDHLCFSKPLTQPMWIYTVVRISTLRFRQLQLKRYIQEILQSQMKLFLFPSVSQFYFLNLYFVTLNMLLTFSLWIIIQIWLQTFHLFYWNGRYGRQHGSSHVYLVFFSWGEFHKAIYALHLKFVLCAHSFCTHLASCICTLHLTYCIFSQFWRRPTA